MNKTVIKINSVERDILKAIGDLILIRESEPIGNKKTNINSFSVATCSGRSYNTVKKYLKKLKDY